MSEAKKPAAAPAEELKESKRRPSKRRMAVLGAAALAIVAGGVAGVSALTPARPSPYVVEDGGQGSMGGSPTPEMSPTAAVDPPESTPGPISPAPTSEAASQTLNIRTPAPRDIVATATPEAQPNRFEVNVGDKITIYPGMVFYRVPGEPGEQAIYNPYVIGDRIQYVAPNEAGTALLASPVEGEVTGAYNANTGLKSPNLTNDVKVVSFDGMVTIRSGGQAPMWEPTYASDLAGKEVDSLVDVAGLRRLGVFSHHMGPIADGDRPDIVAALVRAATAPVAED